MAMTFDATLKDLARDCPQGVLAEFDQPHAERMVRMLRKAATAANWQEILDTP